MVELVKAHHDILFRRVFHFLALFVATFTRTPGVQNDIIRILIYNAHYNWKKTRLYVTSYAQSKLEGDRISSTTNIHITCIE